MIHPFAKRQRPRQQGATLVVVLVVLVLIMMLGIVAVGSSNTQVKLAGNLQFDNNAMNNAEIAVSSAENWLSTGSNIRDAGFTSYSSANTPHLYPTASTAAAVVSPLTTNFTSSNAKCVDNNTVCVSSYVIQLMSVGNSLVGSSQSVGGRATTTCNKVNTYQIIGHGVSGRGAKKTVVSYYSVLNCAQI
jgi:Tfp pilus assembly protein PilX